MASPHGPLMRACLIEAFGSLEQVKVARVPRPAASAGEILVSVAAASINPIDWKLVDGSLQGLFPVSLPRILGRDCVGHVVSSGTSDFRVGDRVIAVTDARRDGPHAEFALVSPEQACRVPDDVSDLNAVAIGNSGATAWTCLKEVANIQKGQRILIQGGAGAVGALAVQIAAHEGAEVITTCQGKNMDHVRSLGAHTVIDYVEDDFARHVSDCDVVLDLVGGDVHRRSFEVLKPGGSLVYVFADPIGPPVRSDVQVRRADIRARGEHFDGLLRLHRAGRLKPTILEVCPIEKARSAYRLAAHPHAPGKIVLTM